MGMWSTLKILENTNYDTEHIRSIDKLQPYCKRKGIARVSKSCYQKTNVKSF